MVSRKHLPAVQDMAQNIASLALEATGEEIQSGKAWYPNALGYATHLAEQYGISVSTAAAVLAVLSPQTEWQRNKDIARAAIEQWQRYGSVYVSTNDRNKRAALALSGDTKDVRRFKGTPKVHNFYRAIIGDHDAVTVDRHALRAALGAPLLPEDVIKTDAAYKAIAAAYREAANALGYSARDLQAIVWLVVLRKRLEQRRQMASVL